MKLKAFLLLLVSTTLLILFLSSCKNHPETFPIKNLSMNPEEYTNYNITIYGKINDVSTNISGYKCQARIEDENGYSITVISKTHRFKVNKYYYVTGIFSKDYTIDYNNMLIEVK